jgi:hypothetical protein
MSKNEIAVVDQTGLVKPGDNMSARITDTNRKVLKVSKNDGADKYSATQYPNGTIVETKTTKRK